MLRNKGNVVSAASRTLNLLMRLRREAHRHEERGEDESDESPREKHNHLVINSLTRIARR